MPDTIKSVCDELKEKLCKSQDFEGAAYIREVQRAIDPKGTKTLTPSEVGITRAFLRMKTTRAFIRIVAKKGGH